MNNSDRRARSLRRAWIRKGERRGMATWGCDSEYVVWLSCLREWMSWLVDIYVK